ncbi:PIG-X/PBN1 protein [Calocera viscosa TUFC12733]|uniref:Protein PBN1 n=1 Tax=Calocera viscosa (strain TUFC12733) TaxID=1330018 RepID=A0A167LLQ5_CALVF|nr:PIG-X/PBN1 protein [Calocera viscosa TUFC12733]
MEMALLLHSLIPSHLYLPGTEYNCTLSPSQGFHRTLSLAPLATSSSPSTVPEDTQHCILQALLFLPADIFADPYELEQRHADGRLGKFRIWGEVDLEAPVSAVDQRGTAVLLDVDEEGTEIPLHLRYPRPGTHEVVVASGGRAGFELPCPFVYWACDTESRKENSPFDDLPPPFTSPYTKAQEFHFLRSQPPKSGTDPGPPTLQVLVPTGDLSHLPLVEWGTGAAVLFAFFYIAYCAWTVPPRPELRHKAE